MITKEDKCVFGKYCSRLKKYGQIYSGKLTKGILLEEFFDKELTYSGTIVRYSKGHQEKGCRFDYCPFCGTNFNIIFGSIYGAVAEINSVQAAIDKALAEEEANAVRNANLNSSFGGEITYLHLGSKIQC